ncbi:DENN domain-containing protein 1B isoform X2 [Brienomyrus brachyistius]|uniref:DENN domain-containing protein 1B isoform X2 n=1 Tax=Brienomyrus brachyistius TaxID=42636 RepID=UPI0020B1FFAF|nr:DENN domain-containing protein 1B isoform X2 [Brienomyrus brachyistius]
MGTRLKENPERTFNWFFEVSCPIAKDKDPLVLFQFPEDYSDEESIRSLPRFCFPYDIERVKPSMVVQHFTFVLTDLEGCQRFGFCRQTSGSKSCLCVLSYLPWFEVFYKLLNNLADYLTKGQTNEMRELLSALHQHPVPQADSFATLQLVPYFIAPDPKCLPSIPESRNLTELVVSVDVSNLLQLYASMLFERRILLYSSKLSTLTACVHACSSVLFPMYWQHIFIPVLPPHLLDYCCAPMPYLIGVHSSLSEKVRSCALEDVVILNIDTNTMESPFDDLRRIPSYVVSALKVSLKKQSAATGTGVARAFLRAQAELFGGYREALTRPTGSGPIAFCTKSFLNHKSKSMRHFLESAVHLQFFKQFIDARLDMLNHGREPADFFEDEILQCAASAGTRPYQQWVGNLKIGGGAILHTVKSKANMCKSATAQAKFCLRNITASKEDSEAAMLYRVGSLRSEPLGSQLHRRAQSDCLQNRLPITQHFGKSRPRRPNRRNVSPTEEQNQLEPGGTWGCSWNSALENGTPDAQQSVTDGAQPDDLDSELVPDPEEMDLLGEIFDTLSLRSSHDRGVIYATRSLDLFGPDTTDFIARRKMMTPSQESLSPSTGRSESLLSWGQDGDLEEGEEGELEEGQNGDLEEGLDNSPGKMGKEDELSEGTEWQDSPAGSTGVAWETGTSTEWCEPCRGCEEGQDSLSKPETHRMEGCPLVQGVEVEASKISARTLEQPVPPSPQREPASSRAQGEEPITPNIQGEEPVPPSQQREPASSRAQGEEPITPNIQGEEPVPSSPREEEPVTSRAQGEPVLLNVRGEEPVPSSPQGEDPVSPIPKVQEAVALFQVKAMKKPVDVWRNTRNASPNGRPEMAATLEAADDMEAPTRNETGTLGESEGLPLVKVSELKKRFEA